MCFSANNFRLFEHMFHSNAVNFDLNYVSSKETLVKIIYQIKKFYLALKVWAYNKQHINIKTFFKDQYRRFNLKIKHKML